MVHVMVPDEKKEIILFSLFIQEGYLQKKTQVEDSASYFHFNQVCPLSAESRQN